MRFSKWILAFFVCPVLSCWLAASTPVTVTNPNDDGSSGELRWAIQQANAGAADTIKFNLTYPATITLSQGVITISANVTIVGPGSANLTINGGGTQIFDINGSPGPNVSISGLAFSGGTAYAGGAIHAENGTLTINNCTFSGNYAQFGGALYAEYSVTAWTISNTAFSGNCATGYVGQTACLGDGGAIYHHASANLTIQDSTFTGNSAQLGGALYLYIGPATITGSTFSGNSASYGGAIYNDVDEGNNVLLSNVLITGNSAAFEGGGIDSESSVLTLEYSTVTNNLVNNSAGLYGGEAFGGGIFNDGDGIIISDSTISGNGLSGTGGAYGAGIYNYTNLTISNSNISGNLINAGYAAGAGIYSTNSTYKAPYSASISNSTVASNSSIVGCSGTNCSAEADGVGIYNSGVMELNSATIANNSSTLSGTYTYVFGGGFYNSHTLTIENSLLANNTAENCYNDDIAIDGGYNLSDDASCITPLYPTYGNPTFTAATDQNAAYAGLSPNGLQNNGGPTDTVALLPDSSAVDAIPLPNCPATDQRGASRDSGLACDIGAYEFSGIVPASRCVAPPTSLVSWWTGDSNENDLYGVNNPAAVSGITLVPAEVVNGFSFGTGAYIDIADSPSLENQKFTWQAWVMPAGPGPNDDQFGSVIVAKAIDDTHDSIRLSWRDNPDYRFVFGFGNQSSEVIYSADTFPPGSFYLVSATYDGKTFRLYVNGLLEGSYVEKKPIAYSSTRTWEIGSADATLRGEGIFRTWNGIIDEVEAYNVALAAGSLTSIDRAAAAGQCKAPVLLSPASENFGTLAAGTSSLPKTVKILNNTDTILTFYGFDFWGNNTADFAVSATTCGNTLLGRQSCQLQLTFTPLATGKCSAVLEVNDSAPNPQEVKLSGTAQ